MKLPDQVDKILISGKFPNPRTKLMESFFYIRPESRLISETIIDTK